MACEDFDNVTGGVGSAYGVFQCDPIESDTENFTMSMGDTVSVNVSRQLVDGNTILVFTGEASLEIYQVDMQKCSTY